MAQSLLRNHRQISDIKNQALAFFAIFNGEGIREIEEIQDDEDFRPQFQHDRDRIIHSRAFRRLKHKTQVFLSLEGDHYRTRLTHTLEVSQMALTIARVFGLNEDVCESIALGHDLGHTPFGHTGEYLLHQIMTGQEILDGLIPEMIRFQLGGFKHNYQSLRVVDVLEKRYTYDGLNLTRQVRIGILHHTRVKSDIHYPEIDPDLISPDYPLSLEAQVVAIADEIAQQTHDLEDGLRSAIVSSREALELPIFETFPRHAYAQEGQIRNYMIRFLINRLVTDAIHQTQSRLQAWLTEQGITSRKEFLEKRELLPRSIVSLSQTVNDEYLELRHFVYQRIINSAQINRLEGKAKFFIGKLFKAYLNNPLQLPDYMLERYAADNHECCLRLQPFEQRQNYIQRYRQRKDFIRLICDYIAGMTDSFAMDEFKKLYLPI
ncbi:MAG: dNTP triphosphohydrolase [Candidatus Delongbacteria bacterium]|nr:dNTP triphosphohydrolase [Candidatus Delongbacteria bacterium]